MGALDTITSINLRQPKVYKVLKKILPIEEKSKLNSEKLFERFYFPQKKFWKIDLTIILKTYIIWVYTYIKRNEKYVLFDMWSNS